MSGNATSEVTGTVVVIEGEDSASGAQAVAPEARGRSESSRTQYVPGDGVIDDALQRRVEIFLTRQAALLDAKDWQGYIDCFTSSGVYWMPIEPGQSSWESEPSIFAEDTLMMEIRLRRLLHPNAWSQAPMWGTNHIVGNVMLESVALGKVEVYSRFQMMELRRDDVRHFGGTYRHTLVDAGDGFHIEFQRVDMMNGQAAYDYVLQAWV
ncbi:MAG: aromatic-ring-hydroxylating dioxygenase subunit beta [Chromatiales bacterium]|jgi:3-phenylpropionate/cinnamic acid dioxygenase small subunit|nr:aromatic-ring-hydroxylating dioxygenase subunit beta [Chromatiales bacterium]